MIDNTIWVDIIEYEGFYKINKNGDVLSIKNNIILKQRVYKGYLTIKLSKNNIKKSYVTHRLIAIHFINNDEGKECINHIDGNKLNNNINNLEWCTVHENNKHALINGLNKNKSKLTYEDVLEIRNLLNNTNMTLMEISIIYGVCNQQISKIKYNQRRRDF